MERSATFTSVPGVGGAAMGAIGLLAAIAGSRQPTPERWLAVWLAAATLAFIVGLATLAHKARQAGVGLDGRAARNFGVALVAPLAAGAAITFALWSTRTFTAMPGSWLLLYGAGVLTGGAFSVPAVRLTGAVFMLLGFVAVVTPPAFGNLWLGAGFGIVHVASGAYIARHHGG